MVSYQKTDILTNTVNTKVHGFPTVLAKEKKRSTQYIQCKEKLLVYTNTHPIISTVLYD